MITRKHVEQAASAVSLALVIAGALLAPTPASITWLSGLGLTFALDLLPGLLH